MPSVKLSVTVRKRLERKYDAGALKKIDAAVKQWVAADATRGLSTVHVAVDDAKAMKALGVKAVTGRVTANKMKGAVDALWARLAPDYLVLFGADDVVPYFVVENPSFDPNGDDDRTVPTDNPYACSERFRSSKRGSYLVPDRVVGRLPDVPGEGDPSWFLDSLATASTWVSQEKATYDGAYAICCDAWKGAGAACVAHIDEAASRLMISPPEGDATSLPASRVKARLHLIKCHGAQVDPQFYGQKGRAYPVALSSTSLRKKVSPRTVAGAMCCYGAQVFSPNDPAVQPPGAWPIASTYLRGGAYGFAGSTMIAWVGPQEMACADWIVAGFLKCALGGASLGRAFLESKQDYLRWINQQGAAPGIEDEKTLIEFVLLGDPSIQPVASTPTVPDRRRAERTAATLAKPSPTTFQERRQRRLLGTQTAAQIRSVLPARTAATGAPKARAGALYAYIKHLFAESTKEFGLSKSKVRVQKLETTFPTRDVEAAGFRTARMARGAAKTATRRESFQDHWSGKRVLDGHTRIRLVKVETDVKGRVLRSGMVESS